MYFILMPYFPGALELNQLIKPVVTGGRYQVPMLSLLVFLERA